MSRSPLLGAVSYEAESSFAEATDTWGTRLSTLGPVDLVGFTWEKVATERTTPYRNQTLPGVDGVKRCSFTTRHYLSGHGSTCAGAATASALEALLGIALGRGSSDVAQASSSGGTTATAGGTVTSINVAQASGGLAGAIFRAGSLGDGRGNGQPFAISAHGTSIMTALTALPAALNNGDVVYAPMIINVPESPSANSITSTRWLLQTANQQIKARGCYPKGFTLSAGNGQLPTLDIEWGGAWWDYASETFPPATSMETHQPAPVAGGSFFLNTVGTATRSTYTVRQFSLTYGMNVHEHIGPGAVNPNQDIVGCRRLRDQISIEMVIDADAAGTETLGDLWTANAACHMLYGFSAADTTAAGLYVPYMVPSGPKPVQHDADGINSQRLTWSVGTGNTTTNELTLSALRIFMG